MLHHTNTETGCQTFQNILLGGALVVLLDGLDSLRDGVLGQLPGQDEARRSLDLPAEVLALKQESRILGQWSNPVPSSRKIQANSPWAKHHRV